MALPIRLPAWLHRKRRRCRTKTQSDQNQINNDQAQLTLLQTNLQTQMAQANALIAQLQQQNTLLQGLFQYDTSNNPNASTAG